MYVLKMIPRYLDTFSCEIKLILSVMVNPLKKSAGSDFGFFSGLLASRIWIPGIRIPDADSNFSQHKYLNFMI